MDEKSVSNRVDYDCNFIRKKKLNILVADDETDIAYKLKEILELRGHSVTVVDDGPRCISHCKNKENRYDVIFIDYHMDGLDGAEVTDILKDDDKHPIIFAYTGDDSKTAITCFKKVGMDGAVIKPVDVECLELLMNNLEQRTKLDKTIIHKISKKSNRSIVIFDEILMKYQ
jgi:CheY-like chemotaxis protein